MKNFTKTLITIVLIFLIKYGFSQQLPNADFENWTGSNPTSWSSLNGKISGLSNTTKTTDAESGTYAVKLVTKYVNAGPGAQFYVPGVLTLGTRFDFDTPLYDYMHIYGGIPFTDKPAKLKGYFKYSPNQHGDSAIFEIYLFKKDSIVQIDTVVDINLDTTINRYVNYFYDTIGQGKIYKSSSVTTYTPFEVPINYLKDVTPDSLNIIIASSPSIRTDTAGSVLYVDNLSFSDTITGINQKNSAIVFISIYPNPAVSNLSVEINFKDIQPTSLTVYNIVGEAVIQTNQEKISGKLYTLNVSSLSNGMYFVKISHGNEVFTRKILVGK